MQNELLRPTSLLHRSPLSYFWLSSGSTPKLLPIFLFLVHRCFCCRNFHSLRHRHKFVNQIVMLQWILTFSCNMVFVIWRFRIPHTHSGGFISFQNTRKFCFIFVGSTTPTILHNFTGHSRSNWCFQLLTRVLDGFLEFLFLRCTNKHSQFGIFSQPCFNRIFSNCLSHNSPANGWPHRFRPRGTTGFSILDHDLGHLCRGRRIPMSGHSDLDFSTTCEHLPFLHGCKRILRLLLVLRILVVLL